MVRLSIKRNQCVLPSEMNKSLVDFSHDLKATLYDCIIDTQLIDRRKETHARYSVRVGTLLTLCVPQRFEKMLLLRKHFLQKKTSIDDN